MGRDQERSPSLYLLRQSWVYPEPALLLFAEERRSAKEKQRTQTISLAGSRKRDQTEKGVWYHRSMKKVVFRNGLKVDGMTCTWCKRRRSGFVMLSRFRWMVYAECGHLLFRGFALPPEELERMKLINQKGSEDPRVKWLAEHKYEKHKKNVEDVKKHDWAKMNMPRGKRYL